MVPAGPAATTAVLTAYPTWLHRRQDDASVAPKPDRGLQSARSQGRAKKSQSALTLTAQFGKDRPLVVAGDGVGDGNLVADVRADPALVKSISTVDNASTTQGQLATALTMVERLVQDKVGQYGLSAGATSLVPKPAG